MPSSEKIAIAAHLHVLLRRKTGRVTDTEWMASNCEYAREITSFARQKAAEGGHDDLLAWAAKLDEIMAAPEAKPRVPLAKLVTDAVRERSMLPILPTAFVLRIPDRQSAKPVDNVQETYPASGFIESTFGSFFGEGEHPPKARDQNAPRYVKGLR